MSTRKRLAQAHAKHAYFCACGKVVHGNGARAMHFFISGDRDAGWRDGHREVSRTGVLRAAPELAGERRSAAGAA